MKKLLTIMLILTLSVNLSAFNTSAALIASLSDNQLEIGPKVTLSAESLSYSIYVGSRMKSFTDEVFAFSPDLVTYKTDISWKIAKDLTILISEECTHGVDKVHVSDEINYWQFSVRKINLQ